MVSKLLRFIVQNSSGLIKTEQQAGICIAIVSGLLIVFIWNGILGTNKGVHLPDESQLVREPGVPTHLKAPAL